MTINRRLQRLQVDYEKMRQLDERSPFVDILETTGTPPEKYLLRLSCKGISSLDDHSQPVYGYDHRLTITLPPSYPREKPEFQMLSQVWHPNIGTGGGVCIGDAGNHGYTPAMGLDDLVVRIIQMIRYENYNPNSAFNSNAASWAREHKNLLPLDNSQIILEAVQIEFLEDIQITVSPTNNKRDDELLDEINII